ncbi:serine/threonine protein kinase [Streptomyces pluripotens]|uniref:non-specific serine/threonine protein kinase n=1 Tax=Streptomyces pluripotens TaxID=1355015 RepID=A0A221P1T9_9ACTN|nr:MULTISPECIES: protein kinase [Streptomyces]ARP71877.1 serine/threonine protein kinase [Streptomyces pluripotens]ASN26124.1 serine/threonine protein kinase [Streptomyces pluripotens]KIE26292.1 serine/threonine protein kinase [Streptomyces sp. MUSC 125]MCH0556358.1 serine/threonine protein kinase [Streptomyces sp. MUM 16J]
MQGLLIAGRYRLADSIGSGGMGRVWRAHDEVLHRTVAIKELTAALYVSESDRAVLLARTRAEARAAARINHSAVVTVHDVLEHDGRPWIVMELVEGNSLADAVKEQGRIEPREAARIGLWVLRALRAAHTAGVLHRDIKPGNVLLGRDGRVLLTDFGIAQIDGDTTITRTGEVVGSVDYLAPERVRGHDPGPSSDLWALGATLYTAVEGRSPFRRTSPLGTMQAVVEEEADEPCHAGPLGPVIAALLRKEPDRRPDAQETEQLLSEVAEGRTPHAPRAFVPAQGSGGHAGGVQEGGSPGPGTVASGYGSGPTVPGLGPGAVAHATRSATGSTAVEPTPAGSATGAAVNAAARRSRAAGRPRRRLRTLALVVAVAAVLGGGAAVAFQQWRGGSPNARADHTTTPASEPSASASGNPSPASLVPAGWQTHHDPLGFSLSLPEGWTRKVYSDEGDLKQIDYTPDGGVHFVRISIDSSPDFVDATSHQKDLEQQLRRLVGYAKVRLEGNIYRDRKGSLWEYTWTALKKDPPHVAGPRHAIEETYFSRQGTEYAIYMSTPAEDWAKTSQQFKWVLRSWQEPNSG